MAHKKAAGSVNNIRDSRGQRLGVKKFGGEMVDEGKIIIRQRGTKFHAGEGVKLGRDHTIFATIAGQVKFKKKQVKDFTGKLAKRTFVSVEPVKKTPKAKAKAKATK